MLSLRVGVIGLGAISRSHSVSWPGADEATLAALSRGHLASWPGVKGATLAAVCDFDGERAEDLQRLRHVSDYR